MDLHPPLRAEPSGRHQAGTPSGVRGTMATAVLARTAWVWVFHQPYLLLTLTTLAWAGNAVASRLAAGHISPMALTALRWVGVVALLAPFMTRPIRQAAPVLVPIWRRILVMGGLGFTAFNAPAAYHTTAVNIAILRRGPGLRADLRARRLRHAHRPPAGARHGADARRRRRDRGPRRPSGAQELLLPHRRRVHADRLRLLRGLHAGAARPAEGVGLRVLLGAGARRAHDLAAAPRLGDRRRRGHLAGSARLCDPPLCDALPLAPVANLLHARRRAHRAGAGRPVRQPGAGLRRDSRRRDPRRTVPLVPRGGTGAGARRDLARRAEERCHLKSFRQTSLLQHPIGRMPRLDLAVHADFAAGAWIPPNIVITVAVPQELPTVLAQNANDCRREIVHADTLGESTDMTVGLPGVWRVENSEGQALSFWNQAPF